MEENTKPTRKQLMEMLEEMIRKMEDLPKYAMYTSVNQVDLYSLMILLYGILDDEKKD
jgi:hypothetical protein